MSIPDRLLTVGFLLLALSPLTGLAQSSLNPQAQWAQWRGPLSSGVAPLADPPIEWSESRNLRWKSEIPGLGHSSPIVWGTRVFLSTAIAVEKPFAPRPETAPGAHDNLRVTRKFAFVALCLDRSDGKILWQRKLHEAIPFEGGHYTASQASASPVTDGEHVYFHFGSYGLFCLNLDGDVVWQRQFGRMHTKHGHGEGSSPALHGDTIAVNWDHEAESFVVALDKLTGSVRWRSTRPEVTSWATPIIVEHDGTAQLIVNGTLRIRAYDLQSGAVIWECGGLSNNVVASPVAGDGMLFAGSSYDTRAILGIRLQGARGDITGTEQVAWVRHQRPPYVPSPLLLRGALYYLMHYQNVLTRLDAATGEEPTPAIRLDGLRDIYASPVAAANRIYISDRSGATLVIRHGEILRAEALNQLDDKFSATPALADRQLFLRGERYLYCIEEPR